MVSDKTNPGFSPLLLISSSSYKIREIFMAYTSVLGFLLSAVVWCTAYAASAFLSFLWFHSIPSLLFSDNSENSYHTSSLFLLIPKPSSSLTAFAMGYAQLVIGPAGSGKVCNLFHLVFWFVIRGIFMIGWCLNLAISRTSSPVVR